jgi:hypothetical protein
MSLRTFNLIVSFILTAAFFVVVMFLKKAWSASAEGWLVILVCFAVFYLITIMTVGVLMTFLSPFRQSLVNSDWEERYFVIWIRRGKAWMLNRLGEATLEFSSGDLRPREFECWRFLSVGKYRIFPLFWREDISAASEDGAVEINAEISFRSPNPGPEYFFRYQNSADMRFLAREFAENAVKTVLAGSKWKGEGANTNFDQIASQIGLKIEQEITAGKDLFNFATIELDIIFPAIHFPQ